MVFSLVFEFLDLVGKLGFGRTVLQRFSHVGGDAPKCANAPPGLFRGPAAGLAASTTAHRKIRQAAPIHKLVAQKLASEFGVTLRSVISKEINMQVEYIKETRTKGQPKVLKSAIVKDIEKALGIEVNSLVNANARDLATLLDAVS